jgi:hypothetical protein
MEWAEWGGIAIQYQAISATAVIDSNLIGILAWLFKSLVPFGYQMPVLNKT